MPLIDGNFQYALTASELFQSGYNTNGIGNTTSLSGDVEYTSRSEHSPFSILYAGGYLLTNNNNGAGSSGYYSSTYQSLMLTQGLIRGPWSLASPTRPVFCRMRRPQVLQVFRAWGDLGLPVQQGSDVPAQDVLTDYARRVSNTVSGNVSRQLNGRTSISAIGSYGGLYFLDGQRAEYHPGERHSLVDRQLDRKKYSRRERDVCDIQLRRDQRRLPFTGHLRVLHSDMEPAYHDDRIRRPQWISGLSSTVAGPDGPVIVTIPSRVTFSGSASIAYMRRNTTATLAYNRSVNGGSGVQTGAIGDVISAGITRSFGRDWSVGVNTNYAHTTGLVNNGNTNTVYAGVQGNRRIGQHLSAFLSYTIADQQLYSGLVGPSSFSGVSNSGSIGITFSPRAARLGTVLRS